MFTTVGTSGDGSLLKDDADMGMAEGGVSLGWAKGVKGCGESPLRELPRLSLSLTRGSSLVVGEGEEEAEDVGSREERLLFNSLPSILVFQYRNS